MKEIIYLDELKMNSDGSFSLSNPSFSDQLHTKDIPSINSTNNTCSNSSNCGNGGGTGGTFNNNCTNSASCSGTNWTSCGSSLF